MEITLMRHGEPEYELKGRAKAKEIGGIIRNYDLSGIKDKPHEKTIQSVSAAKVVVCSDLKRSIDSAKALGFEAVEISRSIFREIEVPHFKSGEFAMSIAYWGVFLRVTSIFGFSRNGESLSMARSRANKASIELVNLASKEDRVLLVGHGLINYFIAKELLKMDWVGPSVPGSRYWSCSTYKDSAI
jgi:broad specificity phosphatase PhoE